MKTVIIEDETMSASVLRGMLAEYCPDVEVTEEINSANDALLKLPELDPDFVFLDIDLGDGDAFDMISKLNGSIPPIIFTTAFNNFAIDAFRLSAIDYLLKPINLRELINSVQKIRALDSAKQNAEKLRCLLNNSSGKNSLKQIALPTISGYTFVEINTIVRFEAEGSYTSVFFTSKESLLLSYNLKHFEEILRDHNFFRVHYSHFINLDMINKYVKGSGGYVVMKDGSKVDIATRRKDALMNVLGIC